MKLLEDWGALVSTNCECIDEDPETGEESPAMNCQGCGEWMTEGALELIKEWLARNDYPDAVMIQGVAIGWQRRAGYALIREAGDKIAAATLDKLMLNSDFTIELKLTGKACHAVRYSHDEPTGASFELHPFTACDGWSECQATEGIREYEGQNLCAYCHEIKEANN
jgi:hypothetical protein